MVWCVGFCIYIQSDECPMNGELIIFFESNEDLRFKSAETVCDVTLFTYVTCHMPQVIRSHSRERNHFATLIFSPRIDIIAGSIILRSLGHYNYMDRSENRSRSERDQNENGARREQIEIGSGLDRERSETSSRSKRD